MFEEGSRLLFKFSEKESVYVCGKWEMGNGGGVCVLHVNI